MTGERLGQAGWLNPSEEGSQGLDLEAGFTGSSGVVRAMPEREKGAKRPGVIRNHSQPSQVVRVRFELERIAVTQRVRGCYCEPARLSLSAGFRIRQQRRRKARQNEKLTPGRKRVWQDPSTFQDACDLAKRDRWLMSKRQPES